MTGGSIIGAVLASGHGGRIGRDKAAVELDGQPLISYPVDALRSAGLQVVLALSGGQEIPASLEDVSVFTTNSKMPVHWEASTPYSSSCQANGRSWSPVTSRSCG